jgi:hypothetical protein
MAINGNSEEFVFSADVLKQAQVEELDYIRLQPLADNNVTFCILNIEEVEITNPQFEATSQWRLTILTYSQEGDSYKYWLSLPLNPKRRDKVVDAAKTALQQQLSDGVTSPIVHSFHVVARQMKQYDHPYYKLEPAMHGGKAKCGCVK